MEDEPQTEVIVCPIIEDDADYYEWLYADDIKRMKEEKERVMSWYSDGEPFDEHDPEWCRNCEGGNSKEQCDRCSERHRNDNTERIDTTE